MQTTMYAEKDLKQEKVSWRLRIPPPPPQYQYTCHINVSKETIHISKIHELILIKSCINSIGEWAANCKNNYGEHKVNEFHSSK